MPKVDLLNYVGKEQAYVKHYLLENYLSKWAYKIGSKWDALVFIDGFAGPWQAHDKAFGDSSFGIAVRVIKKVVDDLERALRRRVRGLCIFVEKKPVAFEALNAFAEAHSTEIVRAKALKGRFIDNIPRIQALLDSTSNNTFKFVFLDQKGWAATPIGALKPFVGSRSCEMLFTLMTSFLTRFVEREDLAPSYRGLFGRADVLERIRSLPKGTGQREEAAVEEYCKSLRELCGFQHVSKAAIMDPSKEKVRYYLVFATNSLHGIEVFKRAESEAAEKQDQVRHETRSKKTSQPGLPFASGPPPSPKTWELRTRYNHQAKEKILALLVNSKLSKVPYSVLYGEAMTFPMVTPDDLLRWLEELKPHIDIRMEGKHRRKPKWSKRDYIFIRDQAKLALIPNAL